MAAHDVAIQLHGPVEPFGSRQRLESFLDEVMAELATCQVTDPRISESYSPDQLQVTIEFAMTVGSDLPEDAVATAMAAIRTSLHVHGAETPGWEKLIGQMRSDIRSSQADNDLVDA